METVVETIVASRKCARTATGRTATRHGRLERAGFDRGFRARPCPGRKSQRFASASRGKGEEGKKKASQGEDASKPREDEGERKRERTERDREGQEKRNPEEKSILILECHYTVFTTIEPAELR